MRIISEIIPTSKQYFVICGASPRSAKNAIISPINVPTIGAIVGRIVCIQYLYSSDCTVTISIFYTYAVNQHHVKSAVECFYCRPSGWVTLRRASSNATHGKLGLSRRKESLSLLSSITCYTLRCPHLERCQIHE